MKTPDVNVLVYAVNLDAPQRSAAARWIENALSDPSGMAFTWHALTGFLRLSTQQCIVRSALPLDTAIEWWTNGFRTRARESSVQPTDTRRC